MTRPANAIVLAAAVASALAALGAVDDASGRPSMGHAGGARPAVNRGGAQPASMGVRSASSARPASMGARPGGANMSRPPMSPPTGSRPSFSGAGARPAARPATPAARPARPSLPSLGGVSVPPANRPTSRPSTRPAIPQPPATANPGLASRPTTRPTTRPSIEPPTRPGGDRPTFGGATRPSTRPDVVPPGLGGERPGITRPGIIRPGGAVTLPGAVDRPSIGGDRPGGNIRPTPLPGIVDRPGGERPGGNRPGGAVRPVPLPGAVDRPGGGNRPGGNHPGDNVRPTPLPGIVERPGGNRPGGNRPGWNRPGWNRPGWGGDQWNRPGWGWGGNWASNTWQENWYHNSIHHHYHNWYNGCWHHRWDSHWYAPVAWGAVGWGLGAWTTGWGYGAAYYNPYFVALPASSTVVYDYSQPVAPADYSTVNYYVGDDGAAGEAPQESPEVQAGQRAVDAGLAEFKSGRYVQSLQQFNAALAQLPGDAVVHELRALSLFALGKYPEAAAALNSLLSSSPGMDWTTMSGLYGNADDYTQQLRKLEEFTVAHPQNAPAHFVLAYHYLVLGEQDAAARMLRVVVANEPQDVTAKRLLDALAPPEANRSTPAPPQPEGGDALETNTDLVGSWQAKAGPTTITLTVSADAKFAWKATQPDKPPIELTGELSSTDDLLTLDSQQQGAMEGTVKSAGPDRWQFNLAGSPPSDPGLTFNRVK